MAFDVYYNRSPVIDALMAYAAGLGQAKRQNDIIHEQQAFQTDQNWANAISGIGNVAARGIFQRAQNEQQNALQQSQLANRTTIEGMREAADQAAQQRAFDQQDIRNYGGTQSEIQAAHPGLSAIDARQAALGDVAQANMVRGLQNNALFQQIASTPGGLQGWMQQKQQDMQQAVQTAGLEKGVADHTPKSLNDAQRAMQAALEDQTLPLSGKVAAIQMAADRMTRAVMPVWKQRTSPLSFQERQQAGVAGVVPGYDNGFYLDPSGAMKYTTLHPSKPKPPQTPQELNSDYELKTKTLPDGTVITRHENGDWATLVKPSDHKNPALAPGLPYTQKQFDEASREAYQGLSQKLENQTGGTIPPEDIKAQTESILMAKQAAREDLIRQARTNAIEKMKVGQVSPQELELFPVNQWQEPIQIGGNLVRWRVAVRPDGQRFIQVMPVDQPDNLILSP